MEIKKASEPFRTSDRKTIVIAPLGSLAYWREQGERVRPLFNLKTDGTVLYLLGQGLFY